MLLAPRLAEHPDVLLPVLVCQDGFTITHSAEPVELLPDEDGGEVRRRLRGAVPAARLEPPDDPGAIRDARLLLRAPPPAGRRDGGGAGGARRARRGARGADRPPLPRARAPTGSTARDRVVVAHGLDRWHDQGSGRPAARRGRAGRAARDQVVPALPGRRRSPTHSERRRPRSSSTGRIPREARRRSTPRSPRPSTGAASSSRVTSTVSAAATWVLADARALLSGGAPAYYGLRVEPCPA